MRPSPSRLLAVTAIVAIGAMLGGCAQPDPRATAAPAPPEAPTSATATPAPTPTATAIGRTVTATPPEAVELVDFSTRNGTMHMRVPSTWTVEDESRMRVSWDGERYWENLVRFVGADGALAYSDGIPEDVGAAAQGLEVAEAIPMADGLAATAWSEDWGDGMLRVGVAVAPIDGPGGTTFQVEGSTRLHLLAFQQPWESALYASRADAEAFLRSPAVRLALDVMATAEFVPDDDALPAGIAVEHEGTTYLPITTQNGSATFLVPEHWTITERSRYEPGDGIWTNAISLHLPSGDVVLGYNDWYLANPVEEGAWQVGEVRPTRTAGWDAVSWAFDGPPQEYRPHVGVSLADELGDAHPTGQICTSDHLCHSFSSFPLGSPYFDAGRPGEGLDNAEAFFGSELEEQMLTVVASLEVHHDDPNRMP